MIQTPLVIVTPVYEYTGSFYQLVQKKRLIIGEYTNDYVDPLKQTNDNNFNDG
jgi:hypothetical protein